jgi:23S rRNA (cytidine1920-2'-O)/16S rRNA (cytidine1409-2'-O)-methyltransferase
VGYGQLAWSLRTDPRVTVMDRVNVRTIGQVVPEPDLVVADLSFISLTLVLPALVACATPDADFVLLVKPQFEVGRDRVGAGGVVRDSTDRSAAVEKVSGAAAHLGLGVQGITASPLPGPAGNVEYFVWLRRGAPPLDPDQLQQVIAASPLAPRVPRRQGQGGRGGLGGTVSPQEQGGSGGDRSPRDSREAG